MQSPSFPVKHWRRFKYRYNALLHKMDPDTARMLGFGFKPPDRIFESGEKLRLDDWRSAYAQFFGDTSKEALQQLHKGWHVECVKHCKHETQSPWHEFLLLEWRHMETQAFICIRLERDSGDKVDESLKGSTQSLLAKQHGQTSIPRSMEKVGKSEPSVPSGPLNAKDLATFRKFSEDAAAPGTYIVLASFAPSKGTKLRLTLTDVLMAASACEKVSLGLYDFRYICYWFARMIYESLLYKAGQAALDHNEPPPVEMLHKRCNSIRGCIFINNIWSLRVNKLDLKWRTGEKVTTPQVAAIAEGGSALIPESEQTNSFKQVFSKKAPAPKLHNALQRVLEAEREVRAEFEIEVAHAKDLCDTEATMKRMRAKSAKDDQTLASKDQAIASKDQAIASKDQAIASLQAQLAQAKLQGGTS